MKTLFNLFVTALAVAAGWYAYPGLVQSMETNKENSRKKRASELAAAVMEVTGGMGPAAAGTSAASSSARELADAMRKTAPPPGALPDLPTGAPMPQEGPTPVVAAAAPLDEIEAKYPLPTFKEITEITREWASIPSRAFPRPVRTLVAINLEGPNGKVPLPEKSEALAVGMTQGMLVLMKNREDPARSLVPLANTDLKETLTTLYEKYKSYKTNQVLQQRERARGLKSRSNGASDAEMAAAGPKPKVESGGIITAMAESLRAKQIKETTEDKVTSWGDLNIEEIDGKTYWTGTIQCVVDNALFGPTPTELMALIHEDKVVKWLYSGSKEEVQ